MLFYHLRKRYRLKKAKLYRKLYSFVRVQTITK
jgi:hypothetical protein